jgi:hypothetical protein
VSFGDCSYSSPVSVSSRHNVTRKAAEGARKSANYRFVVDSLNEITSKVRGWSKGKS